MHRREKFTELLKEDTENQFIRSDDRQEKIRLIGLILDQYVPFNSAENCGKRFDFLYDKSIERLIAYYQVYGPKKP